MQVDTKDILVASQQLQEMAEVYEQVIARLQAVAASDRDTFESYEVHRAWTSLRDTFWEYAADTQDNLNDIGRAFIYYINETCSGDTDAANKLQQAIIDFNIELDRVREEFGVHVDDPLPELNLNNPDQVLPEPDHPRADRP